MKKRRSQTDLKLFYRSYEVERAKVDEEKRSVAVSFSSETPVNRYYGAEYLLHGKENVDLKYLKSLGAALINHNSGRIAGSLKDITLGDDRIARATIVFDDDEDGNWAFNKVKSGSLKGVSVGYDIQKIREVQRNEAFDLPNGKSIQGPAVVATRWMPYEVSLTPIPADAAVGVGRSIDGIERELSNDDNNNKNVEEVEMNEEEIRKLIQDSLKTAVPEIVSEIRTVLAEDAKPKMQIDTETFQSLMGRAGAHSETLKCQVADMALAGKTEREIVNAILDAATPKPDAEDKGNGRGKDGTGNDQKRDKTPGEASFEGLTDEDFFSGLSNPGLMALN